MRIAVVEDIEQQADWLCNALDKRYPAYALQRVRTESEFRGSIEGLRLDPPALAIIDMMLRWSDPAPKMPAAPAEVNDDGRRAGLRCVKLLREDARTAGVPIIIRTVLEDIDFEEGEIPAGVSFVTKESDTSELFRLIEEVLGAARRR
jgi:hypothetical protein